MSSDQQPGNTAGRRRNHSYTELPLRPREVTYTNSRHLDLGQSTFNGPVNFDTLSSRNENILEWLSTIPYKIHHKRISEDRLHDTSEWLFAKEEYRAWRDSTDSKLLLLRGIPGAGKTYTMSKVIDTTAEEKLGYFYCSRTEKSRRSAETILRTLIHQLCHTKNEFDEYVLQQPVIDMYEDRKREGQLNAHLTAQECENILIIVTSIRPQTTICIDALDEMEREARMILLDSLKSIVASSVSVVKIFATARMDVDIRQQLEGFPMIELQPDDNIDDIKQFINKKVGLMIQNGILHIGGDYSFRSEICDVLVARCKGMFQLAKLHMTLLEKTYTVEDMRRTLWTLPEDLKETYDQVYQDLLLQPGDAGPLALSAFRWIQYSYEPLESATLLDAITRDVAITRDPEAMNSSSTATSHTTLPKISIHGLLDVCQNLLIYDEALDVVRFSHVSVNEYLKVHLDDSHSQISKVCFALLCGDWSGYDKSLRTKPGAYRSRHLLLYASVFWAWHFSYCDASPDHILTKLSEKFLSPRYRSAWMPYFNRTVQCGWTDDPFWSKINQIQRDHTTFWELEFLVCVFGFEQIFEKLYYDDVNFFRRNSQQLLGIAKENRHEGMIRLLMIKCCRIGLTNSPNTANVSGDGPEDIVCRQGWTELQIAVWKGQEAKVRELIENGADISASDTSGLTALHIASQEGHENLAQLLIFSGADMSAVDQKGSTALHITCREGHLGLARLLIACGDSPSETALDAAFMSGHADVALILIESSIECGTNILAKLSDKKKILHEVSSYGHTEVIRLLLTFGADVSARDDDGATPLHFAHDEAVAQLLMDNGANISAVDNEGNIPLHTISGIGQEAVARLLIDCGADFSAVNGEQMTPLHIAAEQGYQAVARLLIDRGADISAFQSDGDQPIHIATSVGDKEMVRLLIDCGADISAFNDDGATPLHLVADNADMEEEELEAMGQLLIECGANVSAVDEFGDTPLHVASHANNKLVARLLIDHGTDLSAVDHDECTPLHIASMEGSEEVARLLIDRGANVSAINRTQDKPLDLARQHNHHAIANLLSNHRMRGTDSSHQRRSPRPSHRRSSPEYSQRGSSPGYNDYRRISPDNNYRRSSPDNNYRRSSPDYNYRRSSPDYSYRRSSPNYNYRRSSPDYSYRGSSPGSRYRRNSPDYGNQLSSRLDSRHRQSAPDYDHPRRVPEYYHQSRGADSRHLRRGRLDADPSDRRSSAYYRYPESSPDDRYPRGPEYGHRASSPNSSRSRRRDLEYSHRRRRQDVGLSQQRRGRYI